MKLELTKESANALRNLSVQISTSIDNIDIAVDRVLYIFSLVSSEIGVHADAFQSLLSESKEAVWVMHETFALLSQKMTETADSIDEYVSSALSGNETSDNLLESSVQNKNPIMSKRDAHLAFIKRIRTEYPIVSTQELNIADENGYSGSNTDSDAIPPRQRDFVSEYIVAKKSKPEYSQKEEMELECEFKNGSPENIKLNKTQLIGRRIKFFWNNINTVEKTAQYNQDADVLIEIEPGFKPLPDIRKISSTNQIIRRIITRDGKIAEVFDHPEKLKEELPFSQGNNDRGKHGDCGLANTAIWLKIAGSKYVENDVVNFAVSHNSKKNSRLCSRTGGINVYTQALIWKAFGMDADIFRLSSYKVDNLIERMCEAVEIGRAVSVGINAGKLWSTDILEINDLSKYYGDGGANHVIGIVSYERSLEGKITHLYINDTGRKYARDACRKVSIEDFIYAFNVGRASVCISKDPVW